MKLSSSEASHAEDFVIENNILKGALRQFPDNFQVGKLIFDVLSSKPDHVSQIDSESGKETTFAEMLDRSIRCALWLKKQGIGRNDVVTIKTDNYQNAYIPIFASFFIGATYNALNNFLSLDQTQELIKPVRPKALFLSGSEHKTAVQAAREIDNLKVVISDNFAKIDGFPSLSSILQEQSDEEVKKFQPEKVTDSEDVAFIILSSGTTALPKLIVHTYANLAKQIFTDTLLMNSVILCYSPVYWVSGFVNLLHTTFHYRTKIIHARFDPKETCQVIEKYKVEQVTLIPPLVNQLFHSNVLKNYELKSLKLILTAGAKSNIRVLEKLHKSLPHVRICQLYGFSEAGLYMATQSKNSKHHNSVGYVFPGAQIKIRDLGTNENLGSNTLGEICAKSCSLMKGYLNNEKATKAAVDAEGWYHSGDLGYYNEDGEIFVVDRLVDVIVHKNQQILPSEIEDLLLKRDDVLEAAAVPIPHDTDGQLPVVFVKKAPDSNVTEKELMISLKSLGNNEKFCGVIHFIDELPRFGGLKINRKKLIVMAKALV